MPPDNGFSKLHDDALKAFVNMAKTMPSEAKVMQDYLVAIKSQNMAALGRDDAFMLRNENGEIYAVKHRLELSAKNRGLVAPVKETWVVSAQGYEMWAEAAGAVVVFPEDVLVDGQPVRNPHVARDQNNGRIRTVTARAVAFRYSPVGIPMVADWTTCFDVPTYRMVDLLAKTKYLRGSNVARLGPKGMKITDKDPGQWVEYPLDDYTSVFLNTTHEEAIKWFAEMLNRERKAIDFAQTFARRNALKHLSGLQQSPCGDSWSLDVTCWLPRHGTMLRWDNSVYVNLQRRSGQLGKGQTFALDQGDQGPVIDLKKGVSDIANDEDQALLDCEDESEGAGDAQVMDPAPASSPAPSSTDSGAAPRGPVPSQDGPPPSFDELPEAMEDPFAVPAGEVPPQGGQPATQRPEPARTPTQAPTHGPDGPNKRQLRVLAKTMPEYVGGALKELRLASIDALTEEQCAQVHNRASLIMDREIAS